MDDCFVRYIVMPAKIEAFTMRCADGYCIYINILLDQVHRVKAYNHEMEHIKRGDYDRSDIQLIEQVAHSN